MILNFLGPGLYDYPLRFQPVPNAPFGPRALKEFLWNFDDFLCLSRLGVEASQNIVFNSAFHYVLTEKNRSFKFAKILIF